MSEVTKKIYVIVYFFTMGGAFCLDRDYNFITEDKADWGKIKGEDMIEFDTKFFPNCEIPQWAIDAHDKGTQHIAIWTNYYE